MSNCKKLLAALLTTAMTITSLQWGVMPVLAAQEDFLLQEEASGQADTLVSEDEGVAEELVQEDVLQDEETIVEDTSGNDPVKAGEVLVSEDNEDIADSEINNDGAGVIAEGQYEDVSWSLDNEGLLTIEGSGEFRNVTIEDGWVNADQPGWMAYIFQIKKAKVTLSGAKYLNGMFASCFNMQEVDLSGLNFSGVEDTSRMFESCNVLKSVDLSQADLSNVSNMDSMFTNCNELKEVKFGENVGTDDCNYWNMFNSCGIEELDISGFGGYESFEMGGMNRLKKLTVPEMKNVTIDFPQNTVWINNETGEAGLTAIEADDTGIKKGTVFERVGIGGTMYYYGPDEDDPWSAYDTEPVHYGWKYNKETGEWEDVYPVGSFTWSLNSAGEFLLEGDCSYDDPTGSPYHSSAPWREFGEEIRSAKVKLTGGTSFHYMFYGCKNLELVDFSETSSKDINYMGSAFDGCSNLNQIIWGGLDTSKVTDMSYMFRGCSSLEEVNLSGFSTGSVTDMSYMFDGCKALAGLDVSGFDISNVENMKAMFRTCSSLEEIKLFKDTGAPDHEFKCPDMFHGCEKLNNVDLSGLNRTTTACLNMFSGCSSLERADLSGLVIHEYGSSENLLNVLQTYSTNYMFGGCNSLRLVKLNKDSQIYDKDGFGFIGVPLPGYNTYPANGFRWVCTASGNVRDFINSSDWTSGEDAEYFRQRTVSMSIDGEKNFEFGRGGEGKITVSCEYETELEGISPVMTGGAIVWTPGNKGIVDFELDKIVPDNNKAKLNYTIRSADVNAGSTQVTASFGEFSDTINASVTLPVRINKQKTVIKEGKKEKLYVSAASSIKIKSVKWSSDKPDYATVDEAAGEVSALEATPAGETVTITAAVTDKKDNVYEAKCEVTVEGKDKTAVPVASIASGEVEKGTRVILTCATAGADIYYTTNGSDPSVKLENGKRIAGEGTKLYSFALVINSNITVKAIAVNEGDDNSDVAEYTYTVTGSWGDVTEAGLQERWGDSLDVPDGVWYAFRTDDSYSVYTTEPADEAVTERTYTGSVITFNGDVRVYYGTTRLVENRDYTLGYSDNIEAADFDKTVNKFGKAVKAGPKVTVKGKGNYSATRDFYFTITKADLSKAVITSETEVALAEGKKLNSVKPSVTYKGIELKEGKDYVLKYYLFPNSVPLTEEELAAYTMKNGDAFIIDIVAREGSNFEGYGPFPQVHVNGVGTEKIPMSEVSVSIPKHAWDDSYIRVDDFFNGNEAVNQAVVKKDRKTFLRYGTDFTVDDSTRYLQDAGKYEITLRGTGDYSGTKKAVIEIAGIPAKNVKVAYLNVNPEYKNGKALEGHDFLGNDKITFKNGPVVPYEPVLYVEKTEKQGNKTVKYNQSLQEYDDYEVKYENTGVPGKAKIVYILKGQYYGRIEKTVNIKPYNIKNDSRMMIQVDIAPVPYDKAGAEPEVRVYMGYYWEGKTLLKEGLDYTLTFKNNKKAADGNAKSAPCVIIKGLGNYTGSRTEKFTITKSSLNRLTLNASDVTYKAKAGKFKVVPAIMDGNTKVTVGKNKDIEKIDKKAYRYYYGTSDELIPDNAIVNAGETIRVEVEVKAGTKSPYYSNEAGVPNNKVLVGYYRVIENGNDISKAKVKVNKTLVYDNGEELIPPMTEELTVTLGSGKKKVTLEPTDFEIVSVTGNKFIGKATVTIKGKGAYGGTLSFKCNINKKTL